LGEIGNFLAKYMKIIYIANIRIPTEKAHGFQISKTCEKFAEKGNFVELWFPNRKNIIKESVFDYYDIKNNFLCDKIDSIDFISLDKYLGFLAFYIQSLFFAIKVFLKKISSDVLIYTRDFLIAVLLNWKGKNVVYNAHNWSFKRGLFLKLFLNKKTKIVCNSEGTKQGFIKKGFINVISVPNGVDLEKFEKITESKKDLREELNLPADKKIVLYLGHLYKWKGFDIVVESAKKENNKEILFVAVGGTEKDIERYSKIIKDNSIHNLYLVGHKKQEETPYYLKSADVLLLPNIAISEESEKFTSPIKMFEYMASGNPIVASDLLSIREILNKGNSILFEQGNVDALLESINKILADENYAKKISSQSKEDVKNYTWDKYADKILEFIC